MQRYIPLNIYVREGGGLDPSCRKMENDIPVDVLVRGGGGVDRS